MFTATPEVGSPKSEVRSVTLAQVHDLRMAIWLTPFITDGDTRALLLELTDAIAAGVPTPPAGEVRHAA